MQITKNRIRRDYQPLSVAHSISVVSDGDSPLTQVYDEVLNVYQPNRKITPLVLMPTVTLTASDGSMAQPLTNKDIAADTMTWYLDGKDIKTVAGWKDDVSVNTASGNQRGQLTVARNVMPGETHSLYFECTVADTRTGKNITIVTDAVVLSTTDKSEDDWSVDVSGAKTVIYDPTEDMLAEMEYEVAQGLATYSDVEMREAETSAGSYKHDFVLTVRKGNTVANAALYDVKVWLHDGSRMVELTDNNLIDSPVTEANKRHVEVDLRMVTNVALTIEVRWKDKPVAAVTVGAARKEPGVNWDYLNKTDASAKEDMRDDRVLASTKKGVLKYPQRTHRILWFVTDAKGQDHEIGYGDKTRYSMKKFGLTDTAEIAEYIATEQKPAHALAVTKVGKVLTGKNGEVFII